MCVPVCLWPRLFYIVEDSEVVSFVLGSGSCCFSTFIFCVLSNGLHFVTSVFSNGLVFIICLLYINICVENKKRKK